MSEYTNDTLSAMIFNKACKLINESLRNGNHPLICVSAFENMLRRQGLLDDGFIQAIVNDLSDMYFWHPERWDDIDKKWHTQGIDLYKPYTPPTEKQKQEVGSIDREACFAEIEDITPIQTLLTITVEECAELQQAISKIIRYGKSEQKYLDHLTEEMADTLICVNHLLNLFNNQKEVEKMIDYKLYRSVQRCRKEKDK